MTKVGIVTQARMTSTRLPGKVLLSAGQKSMLEYHLERLSEVGHQIIVATTTNKSDDPLAEAAEHLGYELFRGSELDVLSRFAGATQAHELDVVVRITSDCPLIDGSLVQQGINMFLDQDDPYLFLSNTLERSYPRGFDFEVFSADRLREANLRAKAPYQREHVTPWIHEDPSTRVFQLLRATDASALRLTLDTAADLQLLVTLFEKFNAASLTGEELITLMELHPELAEINSHVTQKSFHA